MASFDSLCFHASGSVMNIINMIWIEICHRTKAWKVLHGSCRTTEGKCP